jgi:hypothetical protein
MKNIFLVTLMVISVLFAPSSNAQDTPPAEIMLFNTVGITVSDSSVPAFNIVIPDNWDYIGSVSPDEIDKSDIQIISLKAADSIIPLGIEIFPAKHMTWSSELKEPSDDGIFEISKDETFLPSMTAKSYLEKIFIPQNRSRYGDLKIVEIVELPDLVDMIAGMDKKSEKGSKVTFTAATMVIEYTDMDQIVSEELFAITKKSESFLQTIDGVVTNSEITVDFQVGLKSPADDLENNRNLLACVLSSFNFDKDWYENLEKPGFTYEDASEILYLLSGIYNRHARNISTWTDNLNHRKIDFPCQYISAWCNAEGRYTLTIDSEYIPVSDSNEEWELMNLS